MKHKIVVAVMSLALALCLCACGSSATRQIDQMISELGEITLEHGDKIAQIEEQIELLEDGQLEKLKEYSQFKRAKYTYEKLVLEEERRIALEKQIDEVEALIDAIGTVTNESDDAIAAARQAYDALEDSARQQVENLELLTRAEDALPAAHAEHVSTLIDGIGQVSLESEAALSDADKAYKALSDDEKALVENTDVLSAAWDEYYMLYARSLIQVTDVSISSPDSAGGVELYFNFVNNSEKTIKYLYFGVTFYNRVNDVVCCKYKNDEVNQCYLTGPYEKGEGLKGKGWHWGDYYSWDIDRVELVNLAIEYTDGTTVTFNSQMMPHVQY